MTPLNQLKAVEYAPESTLRVRVPQPASGMRSPFLGPRGLRVGWQSLIFTGFLMVLFGGAALVSYGGPQGLRNVWFSAATIVRMAIQCNKFIR